MEMYDFGAGAVPARRHINQDASKGGWVAATAKVDAVSHIGEDVLICGTATIADSTIRNGSYVSDSSVTNSLVVACQVINNSVIIGSQIRNSRIDRASIKNSQCTRAAVRDHDEIIGCTVDDYVTQYLDDTDWED